MRGILFMTACVSLGLVAVVRAQSPAAEAARPDPPRDDFNRRDENHDDRLSLDELLTGQPGSAEARLAQQFTVVDYDTDGQLCWEEYRTLPGRYPRDQRGDVPDPMADLRRAVEESWKQAFDAADRNHDGALSKTEWRAKQGPTASPALAALPLASWDRDGDGRLSSEEGQWLLDVAFGFARRDGTPLRTPSGMVVNWPYFAGIDGDRNGRWSREEFVPRYYKGAEAAERLFEQCDANGDGQLNYDECLPIISVDVIDLFLSHDADQDGYLTTSELLAKAGANKLGLARRLTRAFDLDQDGKLSFLEFRATPLANLAGNWHSARKDRDGDKRLSWVEFYLETPPELLGQAEHFFRRFDVDGDGFLSYDEFESDADITRLPPETVIRAWDNDGDGRLSWHEVFAPPASNAEAAVKRHARLREYYENWFRSADADRDGRLAVAELGSAMATFQATAYGHFVDRDADGDGRLSREEYYRPNIGTHWEQKARGEAKRYDVDQDGFLGWREFRITPPAAPSPEQRFSGLDADDDGELSFEEYARIEGDEGHDEARRRFFRFDLDGDERLTPAEYLRRGAGARPPVGGEFKARDRDGDGFLTREECVSAVSDKWRKAAGRDFRMMDVDRDGKLSPVEFAMIPGVARPEDRAPCPNAVADWLENSLQRVQRAIQEGGGDLAAGVPLRDWPRAIEGLSPPLAALRARDWDRDGNGVIVAAECRWWLEVAFGFRRANGADLRTPVGVWINEAYVQGMDQDGDGGISRSEFIAVYWAGAKNAEVFNALDHDGDGRLTFTELAGSTSFQLDPVKVFAGFDVDFDGSLSRDELAAKATKGQKPLAARLIAAFDENRDERLSFYEFSATPFAIGSLNLYRPRQDENDDAKLVWREFFRGDGLFAAELAHAYFARFDRDRDGALDFAEFPFSVRLDKIPPEIAFHIQDKNGDGKLRLNEVFAHEKPPPGDAMALERYEMRLAHAEDRFLADDADSDGAIDLAEFVRSREIALTAARRSSSALARRASTRDVAYWVRKGIVLANAVVMLAVAMRLLRRYSMRQDLDGKDGPALPNEGAS